MRPRVFRAVRRHSAALGLKADTARNMASPAPNFEMYWSSVTIEFVENNCRRPSLYCGRCAEFHDVEAFSSGSTGQRRERVRYCSAGKPATWPASAIM